MPRLVDADIFYDNIVEGTDLGAEDNVDEALKRYLDLEPTVEAIPKEEVRQFIESIQKIKDNHNEYGEPINYGTICGILIEGYRLLDKYCDKEIKDGLRNG